MARLLKHEKKWWSRADADAASFADVRDDVIDTLPERDREQLAAVWQNRAGLELKVGAAFATVAAALVEHGAASAVMALIAQAVRDEVHHAEISAELAARYRGDAPRWPPGAPVHVPELAPATGALRATLHVIAMCCINETLACAVLEASMSRAKSPLVRAGLHSILSDEIDHARAGWAHLASPMVSAETKRQLGPWVKRLLAGKLDALLDEASPMPGEGHPDHGMLSRAAFRAVIHAALDDVVFPGFERAGIDPSLAREWAAAHSDQSDQSG